MWRLTDIEAQNICAFHELKYEVTPECATLVFGDNRDDDSQNSNGSGKSALIEAIAIAITGEALRKVNMDEIINDAFDEAEITAIFDNIAENKRMTVHRILSRKKAQVIEITEMDGQTVTQVSAASVADYNKYILDALGLTKDNVFFNYILTAKKYRSFLACSDKEKKELINRFSNGVLVDQSIEALSEDISAADKKYSDIEMEKAECSGRIDALNTEIENEKEAEISRSETKQQRIKEWKEAIAEKNKTIRELNEQANTKEDLLDNLDTVDIELQKLEKSKMSITDLHDRLCDMFSKYDIEAIGDYPQMIESLKNSLSENISLIKKLDADDKTFSKKLEKQKKEIEKITARNNKKLEELEKKDNAVNNKINELLNKVNQLTDRDSKLRKEKKEINSAIVHLENQIAGTIKCPKCGHEFVLNSNVDIDKTKKEIKAKNKEYDELELQLTKTTEEYDTAVKDGKTCRTQQSEIAKEKQNLELELYNVGDSVIHIERSIKETEQNITDLKAKNERIQKRIDSQYKEMFDQAFDHLDAKIKSTEEEIKSIDQRINSAKGSIAIYEESIKDADKATETDVIGRLKKSKSENETKLKEIEKRETEAAMACEELKHQEQIFVEFKTYLANAKIEAISEITNSFLEAIGTDIRVNLSGYTMLKSGKIREKISVSLTRDGVDCGSFDKFSRGEQTRVELACILAMYELTNENCENGKGLDLLVIDEILDATDEQGLTNVFKALNDTHVTSIVVSHGNIAENYPHRLIVHKENGISFID